MRHASLLICAAFSVCSAVAFAQSDVQDHASAQSQNDVSARGGATASSSDSANVSAGNHQLAATSLANQSEIAATLSKSLDARKNKPGDEVTATAAQDVKANGQVVVPRGSKLIGHVTDAHPRSKGGTHTEAGAVASADSQLGVVFEKAILKDGHEVALNAVVAALAAADTGSADALHDTDYAFAGGAAAGVTRRGGGGLVGGGLVGGVGASTGAALNSVSAGTAGVGSSVSATGTAPRALVGSVGAVGGIDSSGRLAFGSRGVFGIDGLDLSSSGGTSDQTFIRSSTRDVRLERGTRMLLRSRTAGASGASADAAGGRDLAGSAAASSGATTRVHGAPAGDTSAEAAVNGNATASSAPRN